ncbi:hypothetical protein KA107_01820 [Candidatus Pacearchaeota archaeon]|nr:hypothetical protein [Candidatus Pacearchaeota archaeon]
MTTGTELTLEKNSLYIRDLAQVDPMAFVEERDLTADDIREISDTPKEGWIVSLTDALKPISRVKIYRALRPYSIPDAMHFYNHKQRRWFEREITNHVWKHGKEPTGEELQEIYFGRTLDPTFIEKIDDLEEGFNEADLEKVTTDSIRYGVVFALLYPEMVGINPRGVKRPDDREKAKLFLQKADEIAKANFKRHGAKGLADMFRVQYMGLPLEGRKDYSPSYEKAIKAFEE